jgi:hypothetical protein
MNNDLPSPGRLTEAIAAALRRSDDQARSLADLLFRLVPGAVLTACRWETEAEPQLAVVTGPAPTSETATTLARKVAEAPPPAGAVARLALDGCDGFVAPLGTALRPRGWLVVGTAPGDVAAPTILALAAALADRQQELIEAGEELAAAGDLATLGESVIELTHAVNNCLNNVVLQATVLQHTAGDNLRDDVAAIRKEGLKAAALLRPVAAARDRRCRGLRPTDLNRAVRAAFADRGKPVDETRLLPGGAVVAAQPADLKRLVLLLIRLAGEGGVVVCTGAADGRVRLEVRPDKPGATPIDLFDEAAAEGLVADPLTLWAVRSLVKLLDGSLEAASHPEGGLALTVTWKARPAAE